MRSAMAAIIAAPRRAAAAARADRSPVAGRQVHRAAAGRSHLSRFGRAGYHRHLRYAGPLARRSVSCSRQQRVLHRADQLMPVVSLGTVQPGVTGEPDVGYRSQYQSVDARPRRDRVAGRRFDQRRHQPVERVQRGVGSQRDVVPRAGDLVGVGDDAAAAGIGARDRRELAQLFGGVADLFDEVGDLAWCGRPVSRWPGRPPPSDSPRVWFLASIVIDESRCLGQRGRDLIRPRVEPAERVVGLADQGRRRPGPGPRSPCPGR